MIFRVMALRVVGLLVVIAGIVWWSAAEGGRPSADVCATITSVQASLGQVGPANCAPINWHPIAWTIGVGLALLFIGLLFRTPPSAPFDDDRS